MYLNCAALNRNRKRKWQHQLLLRKVRLFKQPCKIATVVMVNLTRCSLKSDRVNLVAPQLYSLACSWCTRRGSTNYVQVGLAQILMYMSWVCNCSRQCRTTNVKLTKRMFRISHIFLNNWNYIPNFVIQKKMLGFF